jgi:hypothetical protein
MATERTAFARLKGLDSTRLVQVAGRLAKVTFGLNSDMRVFGLHRQPPPFTLNVVQRRPRKVTRFDDEQGKLVTEERIEDRLYSFAIDAVAGIVSTPGGRRDLSVLLALLKTCGATDAELLDLGVELLPWVKEFTRMHEHAQLGQVVVDQFFVEPRLIGRFSAKTADNRIDMKFLEEHGSRLRSIRLSFFEEGLRKSVEARSDGVIAVSSSDEDELEHFTEQQHKLFLKHSAPREERRER